MAAMDFQPGDVVEYHSASMNKWIPARVIRVSRGSGTVDLDCKEGVDASRVRPPRGASAAGSSQRTGPPPTSQQASARTQVIPTTTPKLGTGSGAAAGPLSLRPGASCFYRSSTHGWIPATAVRWRPDEETYDLDVKQQVGMDKIKTIQDGMLVEYLSTSTNQWIPAQVLRQGQNSDMYDLDCKAGVHVTRMRPMEGSTAAGPAPADTVPQGLAPPRPESMPTAEHLPVERLRTPTAPAGRTAADPKLERLRRAVEAEDPVELRKRMESRSALNLVGEELDRASHALWVLEARPEALRDLQHAAKGSNIDELQAALEAAAVVGVPDEDLEIASRRLFDLQERTWRYCASDGRHMDLRKEPNVDGQRVRQRLNFGDIFLVAEERHGDNGITYLRLADGRGWAFDMKPGVGTMCVQHYAEEIAMRASQGEQQMSLTIADLRSQHRSSMKAKPAARRLDAIAEQAEDAPGQYVLIEKTAVTPSVGLCGSDDILTTLRAGTVVDVLEVVQRPDLKRTRGRISSPSGWISLLDTRSGKRWAEKQAY